MAIVNPPPLTSSYIQKPPTGTALLGLIYVNHSFSLNRTLPKYCDHKGVKCFHNVNMDKRKCLEPCFGVYADVSNVTHGYEEKFKGWWNVVAERYGIFHNMFGEHISYPLWLSGKFGF